MTNEVKIRVFISYSHLDEEWKNELQGHLSFLKKYGDKVWQDRKIGPGSEWAGLIHEALDSSSIILLLISSHFLESKYCYEIEFKQALKRHENLEAVVVPIIIHDVYWQWREHEHVKGLADLNALPTDGRAVSNPKLWGSKHEAFANVAKGIDVIVTELTTKPPVGATNLTQAQKVAAKFFATSAVPTGKVSSIPDNNHFNKIHTALSNLNFTKQRKKFNEFVHSGSRIGAFLLHGKRGFGQDWILNELLRQLPENTVSTAVPFIFDFGRKCGVSLEAVWEEFGEKVGVSPSELSKLVEAVYALWETKTLFFVLRDIDPREQDYLQKFLSDFWYPLVEKARAKLPESPNYCILFLVSYNDCKWELMLTKPLELPWDSYCPIDLKRLTKFQRRELKLWRDREYRLPPSVTVENILENSDNGLPELVLRNICKLSGDNWKKREKAWIQY